MQAAEIITASDGEDGQIAPIRSNQSGGRVDVAFALAGEREGPVRSGAPPDTSLTGVHDVPLVSFSGVTIRVSVEVVNSEPL